METAYQPDSFQNNAFQIGIPVGGTAGEAFAPYRLKALKEDKELLEMIMLFVKTEDM